jgi:hypothetical protein
MKGAQAHFNQKLKTSVCKRWIFLCCLKYGNSICLVLDYVKNISGHMWINKDSKHVEVTYERNPPLRFCLAQGLETS